MVGGGIASPTPLPNRPTDQQPTRHACNSKSAIKAIQSATPQTRQEPNPNTQRGSVQLGSTPDIREDTGGGPSRGGGGTLAFRRSRGGGSKAFVVVRSNASVLKKAPPTPRVFLRALAFYFARGAALSGGIKTTPRCLAFERIEWRGASAAGGAVALCLGRSTAGVGGKRRTTTTTTRRNRRHIHTHQTRAAAARQERRRRARAVGRAIASTHARTHSERATLSANRLFGRRRDGRRQ